MLTNNYYSQRYTYLFIIHYLIPTHSIWSVFTAALNLLSMQMLKYSVHISSLFCLIMVGWQDLWQDIDLGLQKHWCVYNVHLWYSTSNLNFDNSILFYLANFLFYSVFSILHSILSCCTILYHALFCILFYNVFYSILSCSLFYSILFCFLFCQFYHANSQIWLIFSYSVNFNLLWTYMYIIQ